MHPNHQFLHTHPDRLQLRSDPPPSITGWFSPFQTPPSIRNGPSCSPGHRRPFQNPPVSDITHGGLKHTLYGHQAAGPDRWVLAGKGWGQGVNQDRGATRAKRTPPPPTRRWRRRRRASHKPPQKEKLLKPDRNVALTSRWDAPDWLTVEWVKQSDGV